MPATPVPAASRDEGDSRANAMYALLIGFVLAVKVEESVYHAMKTYGLSFMERPLVIALLILTILSVIAAAKFKQPPPNMTEDSPYTHKGSGPQLVFACVILVFTLIMLGNSFTVTWLSGVYPQIACAMTLLFLAPLFYQLITVKRPHTVF